MKNTVFLMPRPDPWRCLGFQDDLLAKVAKTEHFVDCPLHSVEAEKIFLSPMTDFQHSAWTNTSHQEPTVRTPQGNYVPHSYSPLRTIQHSQVLPQVTNIIAKDGHRGTRHHVSADPSKLGGLPSQQLHCAPPFRQQYIPTPAPPNQHFAQAPFMPPYILPPSAPLLPPTILHLEAKRNRATSNSHHQGVPSHSLKSSQATQPGPITKPDANIGTAQIAGYEPSLR